MPSFRRSLTSYKENDRGAQKVPWVIQMETERSYPFVYALIAFKYLDSSSLTLGARMTSPIILGKSMAKIIASEKSNTDCRDEAAPTITNRQKIDL